MRDTTIISSKTSFMNKTSFMRKVLKSSAFSLLGFCALTIIALQPTPASAADTTKIETSIKGNSETGEYWQELKQLVYKDQIILPTKGELTLDVPYRATDDRRVPVTVKAKFIDGRTIKKITVIIDENPMPVSAVFDMKAPRKSASFSTFMRFNGPSPMRAIVEASDGKLYMAEKYVKTSGLGACAAPPIGNPKELMAGIGTMKMLPAKTTAQKQRQASQIKRAAHLTVKHPNLTGLQMDQITLQYILARFVKTIEVSHGNEQLFSVRGSISFSQNPELTFDYLFNGSENISVKLVDTDKATFKQVFPVGLDS